mmetsp:Transcript_9142/g.19171  ORF Transcript_9142/g.19171 Transcript_9142/m.19171 type:complete len:375 (+) Transcript_9142:761-1885(+)
MNSPITRSRSLSQCHTSNLRIPPLVRESLPLLRRLQNLKGTHQRVIHAHHRPGIIKLSAIIRRRKQRDQLPPGEELVPVLHHLMRPTNQVQIVLVQKLRHDVLPKRETHPPIVLPPAVDVLVGVAPQQVAQEPRVGHVRGTNDPLDLIERRELRAEPAVRAKDLLVDDGRAGEAVEAVRECLPELDPEAALALVVEAVDAVDGGALVVAPEDEEVLGVFDLVGQEEADGLEGLLAAVDVVAQEDVVGLGGEAAVFEEAQQVVVLAVDVAADLDGGFELQEHGLRDEEVAGAEAEHFDFGFREVHLLAGAGAADGEEFVDDDVDGVGEEGDARHVGGAGPVVVGVHAAAVVGGGGGVVGGVVEVGCSAGGGVSVA